MEKNSPKLRANIIRYGYAAALFSSVAYSLWDIALYSSVGISGAAYLLSLPFIYVFAILFSGLFVLVSTSAYKGKVSFSRKMLWYAFVEGALYALFTIFLLYAFTYSDLFPLTISSIYVSTFIFAFMVKRFNRSKVSISYFVATAIVVLGLMLESNFLTPISSISIVYLGVMCLIVAIYALAIYYSFYPMYLGYTAGSFMLAEFVMEFIVALPIILIFGAHNVGLLLSPNLLKYIIFAGLLLFLGWLSDLYSFHFVRKAKANVIDTANILADLELFGVAIYSIIFMHVSPVPMLISTFLIISGIVMLHKVKV